MSGWWCLHLLGLPGKTPGLLFIVPEVGRQGQGASTQLGSGDGPFLACRCRLLPVPSRGRERDIEGLGEGARSPESPLNKDADALGLRPLKLNSASSKLSTSQGHLQIASH